MSFGIQVLHNAVNAKKEKEKKNKHLPVIEEDVEEVKPEVAPMPANINSQVQSGIRILYNAVNQNER